MSPVSSQPHPAAHRIAVRAARLRALGFTDYDEYLRSPHWISLRYRYRGHPELRQSCICGASEGLLLHHRTYERLGEEELTYLLPLCPPCHAMLHELERRGDIPVGADPAELLSAERAERYGEETAPIRERAATDATEEARSLEQMSLPARLLRAQRLAHQAGLPVDRLEKAILARIETIERRVKRGY
jgi:hypothetical protein